MIEDNKEFMHSWFVFVASVASILFLMISNNFYLNVLLSIVLFFIYFKNGLKYSLFRKLFIYAFAFSFSVFFLKIYYPAEKLKTGEVYTFLSKQFYETSLVLSFKTMFKLFIVSLVSMSSGAVINYTKVVLYLIVHRALKLFWGYPILLAMNSISLFKSEYDRIKINTRLRMLPFKDKVFIFFPLLVFAIRHSQRGAMSLVTRGLNESKSFYFSYSLTNVDKQLMRLFWIIYISVISAAIYWR